MNFRLHSQSTLKSMILDKNRLWILINACLVSSQINEPTVLIRLNRRLKINQYLSEELILFSFQCL